MPGNKFGESAVRTRTLIRVVGFLLLVVGAIWAQSEDKNSTTMPSAPASPRNPVAHGGAGEGLSFQASSQLRRQSPPGPVLPDAPVPQPLSQVEKFQVFIEEARSPLIFGAAGLNVLAARETQDRNAAGGAPGLPGFATLYEASVVQRESSAFLGKFLYPSLLKQDPRYFPSTSNSFFGRSAYAASRLLITRNDNGRTTINTSYLLAVLTSAAVATAYRPYWARTSSTVFADFGCTIGSDAGMNLFHEFWPAIRNKLQGHSPRFVQKVEKFSDRLSAAHAPLEPAANSMAGH